MDYDLRLLLLELEDLYVRLLDDYNDGIQFDQHEEDRLAVYNAIEIISNLRKEVR